MSLTLSKSGRQEPRDINGIVARVDECGYCIVPDLISVDEAAKARRILMQLAEGEATDKTREARTQRVGEIAVKHRIFRDLLCHPLVMAVWENYLGEDFFCSSWSANIAYPGFDRYGWHVDYPYWSITPPWPLDFIAGQTVWMLDDFCAENGATGTVPCSHRFGRPPHEPRDRWCEEGIILEGGCGSVAFAHGAWHHTARPNRSDDPRCALLGMYLKPCLIPQEDMHSQLAGMDSPTELERKLMGGNQHRPRNVGL